MRNADSRPLGLGQKLPPRRGSSKQCIHVRRFDTVVDSGVSVHRLQSFQCTVHNVIGGAWHPSLRHPWADRCDVQFP